MLLFFVHSINFVFLSIFYFSKKVQILSFLSERKEFKRRNIAKKNENICVLLVFLYFMILFSLFISLKKLITLNFLCAHNIKQNNCISQKIRFAIFSSFNLLFFLSKMCLVSRRTQTAHINTILKSNKIALLHVKI